ncbi:hypothetical protein [Clostridium cellulovorans]|uniref:Uncharacterized protein n=1 Tax=Clostridium cellulovorans (strain ATCC 35296 / DSM 3052 / OCM 3 / 743B) TaxID=573061 RepID=D9STW8_CLOC7|nr:hypothetical protein [Clostridium cellulovorans]ADL50806.1 hypothetical protein Clocel_1047 [Clostridium cellulovorans 743B]
MDNIVIQNLSFADCQTWLNLAHESDKIVENLISDINIFYEGFDLYMNSKYKKMKHTWRLMIIQKNLWG